MTKTTPISEPSTQSGRGCLILFGLIFGSAGFLFFYLMTIRPWLHSREAADWPTAVATILESQVEEHWDDDGSTYSPEITFRFDVNGRDYNSSTWTFDSFSSSRRWADRIVDRYPKGSQHPCYYSPEQPENAVLDRSFGQAGWFHLFPLIFVFIGFGLALSGVFFFGRGRNNAARDSISRSRPSKVNTLASSPASPSSAALAPDVPWIGKEGPQRLEPVSSPLVGFLFLLFFAAIWNGVTWTILIAALRDDGWFSFAVLFLSIFVLIGAAVALGTVYMFLQLFNPKVSIALSEGAPYPGNRIDLAWEVTGRSNRIRRLEIHITATEHATYTVGTDTRTDTHELVRIPVASVDEPDGIPFGSTTVDIPTTAMHSFSALRNEIRWSIQVKGDIPFWPDINTEYRFHVRSIHAPEGVSA